MMRGNRSGCPGLLAGLMLALPGVLLGATVEPEPGRAYAGNTEIGVSSLGVRFTIPAGWQGALSADGEAFLMQPGQGQAYLIALADRMNKAEALQTLAGPVPLDAQLQLLLQGSVQQQGSQLSARYSVAGQPTLTARARARVGSGGVSAGLFLVAESASIGQFEPALSSAFRSLKLESPQSTSSAGKTTAETSGNGGGSDRWSDYLKGKHILRFFSGSGYTEEQHLWLCSDGTFFRRFDGGGFGGGSPGASGAFQSHYDGRWQATGQGAHGQLILNFNGEQTSQYALRWDYEENKLYVDGKRWLHDKNEACR